MPILAHIVLGQTPVLADVLLLCLLHTLPVAQSESNMRQHMPDANELQAECLEYRHATTLHGYVLLHVVDEHHGSGPNAGRREVEQRIWISGDRLRYDIRGRSDDGVWRDWERYVIDSDKYIWIPGGEFEGMVAPTTELAEQDGGAVGHFVLFHPRWLGMSQNSESLMQIRPGSRFVNSNMTKAVYKEVTKEVVDGLESWRVTRETSFPPATPNGPRNPGEFIMWIAPEAGHSLLRAELREYDPKRTMVRSVESRLEQFPHDGVWFPREIIRETKYGDKVTRRQVITVRDAEFGRPPDDAVFTLQGMELTEGKRISDRTAGSRPTELISDGTNVVQLRGPTVEPAAVPYAGRNRIWLLVLNAIMLAFLAVVFFVRMLRTRHPRG